MAVLAGPGLLFIGLRSLASRKTLRVSWVHSLSSEPEVAREELDRLAAQVKDVREDPEQPLKPKTIILLSNTFEEDLTDEARRLGFQCYQPAEARFERVR